MMFEAFALIAAIAGVQATDPLAPARAGKLECVQPNLTTKTCQSISTYSFDGDTITSTSEAMIAPSPLITYRTTTPVTVKDGATCGRLTKETMLAGKVMMDGAEMPAEQSAPIVQQVIGAIEGLGMIGPELCTRYKPNGDTLMSESSFDGVARPEFSVPTLWISPEDGWKVGG